MPSVEMEDDILHSSTLERPSLKSHKALPRRREADPHVEVIRIFHSPQDEYSSNSPTVATAPALPLTPPGATHEDMAGSELDTPKFESYRSNDPLIGVTTPQNTHPPTPETTPPRTTSIKRPGPSHFGQSFTSSRAESFQTAREMMSSDGDTETPGPSPPSTVRSSQRVHPERAKPLRNNEYPIKYAYTRDEEQDGVGNHGAEQKSTRSRHGKDRTRSSPIAPVEKRKSPRKFFKRSRGSTDGDAEQVEIFLAQEGDLRDQANGTSNSVHGLSIEQFREEIGWPPAGDQAVTTERPESRGLERVSTASTVEVMIVDSPRSSKRTLRHSEKRASLRSTSSPVTKSERTSVCSDNDSQHRLVHKAGRISEKDRRSIMSNISGAASTSSGATNSHIEIVPVVVIPERQSSLKSSASNSRNQSATRSQRSSRRGTNATGSRTSSVDRQAKHTDRESLQDSDLRGRNFGRPVIPARNSSLSAPTSNNNSRATSLTSESLRSHTMAVESETPKHEPQQPAPEPKKDILSRLHERREARKVQSILIGVEDMSHLRPPSIPFTPASIQSSSPGLIEINDAITRDPPAVQTVPVRLDHHDDTINTKTPEVPLETPPIDLDTDSPLRNPRPPPKPPVCAVVPPTPENATEHPPEGSPDTQDPKGRFRRFGSVRRVWNSRPRSDSLNSLKRSFSTTSAWNRKAGKDLDSKLHPFWRPRRFWDDSPQLSPQAENNPSQENQNTPYVINNSLGLPQQHVVYNGPSVAHHTPETRRLNSGLTLHSNISRANLVGSRVFSPDFFHTGSPLQPHRFNSLSRWGLRFRFMRMRNLRKRVKRTVQQRQEGKREARRQKLKQSIVVMGSGALNRSTMRPLD